MKNIILLLVLLLIQDGMCQVVKYKRYAGYYRYIAITDTAINITPNSATLIGSNLKIKSNNADTLATRKNVENYIVCYLTSDPNFRDSIKALRWDITGLVITSPSPAYQPLLPNTEYAYYNSVFVLANDGDTDYYKGETKTFTTPELPVYPPETIYYANGSPAYYTDGTLILYTIP